MKPLLMPSEARDAGMVGRKAAALAALATRGFDIPPWCVLTDAAFAPDGSLTAPARDALTSAVRALVADGGLMAVRSSAVDEDGGAHSFAGQFVSLLEVTPDGLSAAVATVRRSGDAERAMAYRRHHGLPAGPPPAVIVQRMVPAEASGVAFGADPVGGGKDLAIVTAVRGTAQHLAEGTENADTWHVDGAGRIVSRRPAPGGGPPVMDEATVLAVAALTRRAGEACGGPQDIEWAWHAGRLWLLQSRPITALPSAPEPTLWDNSNIVESYGGITLPLTFSFARRAYAAVYRQFCRILSVPSARIAASEPVFQGMLGHIRGRVYYNLLNWYRLLALLPGYRLNRRFMEQMMGVREPLPDEIAERIAAENAAGGPAGRLVDAFHVARSMASLAAAHCFLPLTIRRFRRRLNEALRPPVPPLDARSPEALVAHLDELESRLLTRWDAPLLNDFFAMIFFGVLRGLMAKWAGDARGSLHNDLLCGEGGMISAAPAERLRRMAAIALCHPAMAAALRSRSLTAVADAMKSCPDFSAAWHDYLDAFGERCLGELKLENPTLHDHPQSLLDGVARLLDEVPSASTAHPAAVRATAEARVADALHGHPVRRALFHWVLRHARARVRDRENLRFERTRVFGRARRLFTALGRRLHEAGHLDGPRDVFLLEVDEIRGAVADAAAATGLRGLVARRRAMVAAWEAAPPPPERVMARGRPDDAAGWEARGQTTAEVPAGTERLHGTGCCPGVVRGRVRRITDPRGATLLPGEILVAERTDPGWILLFPAAAAILVERGSLLSHSAIVARELGIPAVVAAPGLMTWLADGDEVLCDGATGEIIRLHPAAAPHMPNPAPSLT